MGTSACYSCPFIGSQLAPHPGLVYELVKNRSLKPLPTAGAEFVDFASDSRTAIVRSGGNVSLWDVDRNSQLGFVEAGGQTFTSRVVMSPDGRLMAACSGMRVISWNVQAVLDGKIR